MSDSRSDLPGAVVTGAGSGIGRGVAIALGRRGHPLLLIGRRSEPLAETLRESGGSGRVETLDVRVPGSLRAAVERAANDGFRPAIAFPAAGVARVGPFESLDDSAFEESLATNLMGSLHLYRAVLPHAVGAGGHLFAVLSAAALRVFPGWTAYCASKWALRGAFEALREELKGRDVRLTAVYPGATATPLWNDVPGEWDRSRMIPVDEVARAVVGALEAAAAVPEIHLQPPGGDL